MYNVNINTTITTDNILKATKVLTDHGIPADKACEVLKEIGYTLLAAELFPKQEGPVTQHDVVEACRLFFNKYYADKMPTKDNPNYFLDELDVEDLEDMAMGQYPERAVDVLEENGWPVDDGEIEFGSDAFGWAMDTLADLAEDLLYKAGIWED